MTKLGGADMCLENKRNLHPPEAAFIHEGVVILTVAVGRKSSAMSESREL